MKRKKILAVVSAFVLVFAFVANTLAANNSAHRAEWGRMPIQKQSSHTLKPTKAIQAMLYYYNSTTHNYISGSGGIDGVFGSSTTNAVKSFQNDRGLSQDGIVGPDTWRAFYYKLDYPGSEDSSTAYYFTLSGVVLDQVVIKRAKANAAWYTTHNNSIFYQE